MEKKSHKKPLVKINKKKVMKGGSTMTMENEKPTKKFDILLKGCNESTKNQKKVISCEKFDIPTTSDDCEED